MLLKEAGRKTNMEVSPESWGMSLDQFNAFIDLCKAHPKYKTLKKTTEFKKWPYVNMYDIVDEFVKPLQSGTGCGIGLLMNQLAPPMNPVTRRPCWKNTGAPQPCKLMLSHAWSEDVP